MSLRDKAKEANNMAIYKRIRELWNQPKKNMPEAYRERLILWRREPATLRLAHPTRLDRARSLGYRAKQGIFVVRQRVIRGGRMRERPAGGRRPHTSRRLKILEMNYGRVAEQRVQKKYPNCVVLNSYNLAEDGIYKWYEIILVDKAHPAILADKKLSWVANPVHKGRVYRGLTSTGRSTRGLLNKGAGAEKLRPSRAANLRRKWRRQS